MMPRRKTMRIRTPGAVILGLFSCLVIVDVSGCGSPPGDTSSAGDDAGATSDTGGQVFMTSPKQDASSTMPCSGPCADATASVCGDGVVEMGETCDDGNSVPADGCSGVCQTENGYSCTTPGAAC